MNEIPMITVQLDGIREQLKATFAAREEELQLMVSAAVDKILSTDHIQVLVDKEVQKTFEAAIGSISTDYRIREAMIHLVEKTLQGKIEE